MLHHIIVKWNADADKESLISKVKELYSSATEIKGINRVEIKENIIPRDNRLVSMRQLKTHSFLL